VRYDWRRATTERHQPAFGGRKPEQPLLGAPIDVFRDAARTAKIGPDEDVSHVSASLIDEYPADSEHLGLLTTES